MGQVRTKLRKVTFFLHLWLFAYAAFVPRIAHSTKLWNKEGLVMRVTCAWLLRFSRLIRFIRIGRIIGSTLNSAPVRANHFDKVVNLLNLNSIRDHNSVGEILLYGEVILLRFEARDVPSCPHAEVWLAVLNI